MNRDFIKIIDVAKSGDNRAFEDLYNMTKDSAYFVALSITKNEHDAMDILQDSYIKAFDNLNTLKQPEVFDNWLNRIVANNSKKYISKNKPLLFADVSNDIPNLFDEEELNSKSNIPHEVVDSKETSRMVMDIIDNLSEDKRLIVLMYYYQEMMVKEISETLDLPVTTVKYKLLSARQDMKKDIISLEKKGTKLYSVAPLAIISSILKVCASSLEVPAFASVLPNVMTGAGGVAGVAMLGSIGATATTTTTAGTIATGTVAGTTSAAAGTVATAGVTAGSTAMAGATAAAIAETVVTTTVATSAVGGVAGFLATVGGKVVATTLAVAVIGGGTTVAVVNNMKENKTIEVDTEITQTISKESSLDKTSVETNTSKENETIPQETTKIATVEEIPASEIVNMTTEGFSSMDSIKKASTFEVSEIINEYGNKGVTYTGKYVLTENGNEDEIVVSYDGEYTVSVEINGIKNEISGDYIENVEIIDIDKDDIYSEVVIFDEGPSADPHIHIFRYVDDNVIEVGEFGANYTYDSILFDGKGRIIGGRCYIDFIDTEIVAEFVEMEDKVAKTYTPDYSGLLNKKYTITENVYVAFKETEDMDAYPDLENLMTLEKGWEITFIKGDPREALYYIELPDGRKGVVTTHLAG